MPEGDSVYRLARRLDAALAGRRIERAELRVPAWATTDLGGQLLQRHDTHGKHLLTRFEDGRTLHTHLRMDGSWTVVRAGRQLPAAARDGVRVLLATTTGATAYGLDLPIVEVLAEAEVQRLHRRLGPDPLRDDWEPAEAERRLMSRPDRPVIAALLDQSVIAGLGNLWVNELCFLRGIDPWTPVGRVDVPRLVRLAARCLRSSATLPGQHQVTTGRARKGESHWVVGRAGRPCLRCGTVVRVQAEVPGDPERRRTWWCPSCQPAVHARLAG